MDRLELLQRSPGADGHARERRLREMRRHLSLVPQALVQALQKRSSAGEHDAAVHDVRGQLWWGPIEGLLDGVDDRLNRLVEGHPDLLAREHHGLRKPGHEVASPDLRLHLLRKREGRADLELDLLRGLLTDHQFVLALDVVDDRLVELVAADADRLRDDDAAERDDGHLAGAAADVDDHVPRRLAHRKAGADRGGHRLLDQVRLAGAGAEAGLLDGALLHPGHAGRHAHDHARVRPAVLVHLLDEVAEHLLRDVEVGDHAVLERADRRDRAGCATQHALCLDPDGVHLGRAAVDRDHRGLGQHDAAPTQVYERVRGAEVDRHVAAPEAGYVREKAHGFLVRLGRLAAASRNGPAMRGAASRAAGPRAKCNERICERFRAETPHESSSGATFTSSATGSPTTFQKSPSTASTSAAPRPWMAYPPARSRHSPLSRYQRMSSSVTVRKRTRVQSAPVRALPPRTSAKPLHTSCSRPLRARRKRPAS